MNDSRFRSAEPRADAARPSGLSTVGRVLANARLDVDLPFDMLSPLLGHAAASAPGVVAWMLHEDVPALVHHPLEVAAAISWASGFFLLSLTVRAIARTLRRRHTLHRQEASSTD